VLIAGIHVGSIHYVKAKKRLGWMPLSELIFKVILKKSQKSFRVESRVLAYKIKVIYLRLNFFLK